jgi:hypothetical protein
MRFHCKAGLSQHQLDVLLSRVERVIPDWDKPTGRPHALPLWKAVVLLCFLLGHNNARVLAAELSEISQPAVSRYNTRLPPVVRDTIRSWGSGSPGYSGASRS